MPCDRFRVGVQEKPGLDVPRRDAGGLGDQRDGVWWVLEGVAASGRRRVRDAGDPEGAPVWWYAVVVAGDQVPAAAGVDDAERFHRTAARVAVMVRYVKVTPSDRRQVAARMASTSGSTRGRTPFGSSIVLAAIDATRSRRPA